MVKNKKKKMNNKMVIYLIIGAVVILLLTQSKPKEAQPTPSQPTPTLALQGCTNTCSAGYNQMPFSDCSCYIPQITPLDNDGDGIPDSQDPDDDNDGFSDDEENEAGTDPLNPNDYPTTPVGECMVVSMDCGTTCWNMGYNTAYCTIEGCPPNFNYIGDYSCSDTPPCQRCCCGGEQLADDDEQDEAPVDEGPECSDSDWSGNTPWPEESALSTQSFTYGYVTHNMEGYASPIYDTCQGIYVYERFCNYAGYLDFDSVYCEEGCSGGKCNAAPPSGPANPICGHSAGQYCYGYDVAYHSPTWDSDKCDSFPKSSGSTCLSDCAYKGFDNYEQYCWCWDTDVCESWESCGSSGCYGSYQSCSDYCSAQGTTSLGCVSGFNHCYSAGGEYYAGQGDDCVVGCCCQPSYPSCSQACADSGRAHYACMGGSSCKLNHAIETLTGNPYCQAINQALDCCCVWKDKVDACNSWGYPHSACVNTLHSLYNPSTSCSGMWLDEGNNFCSSNFRLCCLN